ncbi:MAG: hypothetical protein ABEJ07_04870 [Candidatus Nanohaloarchaea archaeon]
MNILSNPLTGVTEKVEDFRPVMIALGSIVFAITILIPWLERMPGVNASTSKRTGWIQEGFNILASLSMPTWLNFLQNPVFWGVIALIVVLIGFIAKSSGKVTA